MKWTWEARDLSRYSTLLPDDFGGGPFTADTAGSSYRGNPWTREDQLIYAGNLFNNATSIHLEFPSISAPEPDTRAGMAYPWHQLIQASISVAVTTPTSTTRFSGPLAFYLVRGDSAALTPVMIASGMPADSSRWYIEHWESLVNIRPRAP